MQFIADLHIHSHFSRATSKQLVPEQLDYWAGIKGVNVVGTGDFTHPGWLAELKEKLEPEGNGLFRLKKEYRQKPLAGSIETRFILTAEISSIYKRGGKVRKVHNVVLAPGFEAAEKINQELINLGGNLKSDGRPILGLDSRNLLEIVLENNPENYFIPAHIWTPWFSMLGSKSGFDSPEECFGELWKYIHTIETGLSTDAPMNWLCSFLDRCTLVSNSDAHSPDRLGRNANVFDTELSYQGITGALESGSPEKFMGTIDLFPQEGKYHFDGHRKCNVCWNPAETIRNNETCPVCGKPVTIGVMNRVVKLSNREDFYQRENRLPFHSIIPLAEILAEIAGQGESSKKVQNDYEKTILKLGSELDVLLNVPLEEIGSKTTKILAEAIRRMRNREVLIQEGYDGEYGVIKVFNPGEVKNFAVKNSLFAEEKKPKSPPQAGLFGFDLKGIQKLLSEELPGTVAEDLASYKKTQPGELNPEQKDAIGFTGGTSIILAGPGTGKTKTLTSKIEYLLENDVVPDKRILAITFTNKAAEEMKNRLRRNSAALEKKVTVSTFHSFGKSILDENPEYFGRQENPVLIDENDKIRILESLPGIKKTLANRFSEQVSQLKQGIIDGNDEELVKIFGLYEESLQNFNAFDFDDLIVKPVEILKNSQEILQKYHEDLGYVLVDEYQDTNQKQFELVRLLAAGENPNLCVVGDPDQAIYGFRGGGQAMISSFMEEFPAAKVFQLKTSYRCSQNILNASANVIERNHGFLEGLDLGVKLNFTEQATDKSEAEFIAREIVKMAGGLSFFSIDSGVTRGQKNEAIESLSDFAVLCRTRFQFQAIEKAFNDHNIPCQAVGDRPFFRNPPFSELLEIFYAAVFSGRNSYSKWLIRDKNLIFKEKLATTGRLVKELPAKDSLKIIRREFFPEEIIDETGFRRLCSLAEPDKTNEDFISSLKLGSASDTYNEKLEAVTLMTLHASKGLEFECVFIAGCEQGLIPYTLYKTETNIDEEARLLYVGMTRAKKFLYLSNAKTRNFRNRVLNLQKSNFLDKIEKGLVERIKSESKKKKEEGKQLDLF
jgi:DNA helicase II / ATP-dependent DNA helicase PcrA